MKYLKVLWMHNIADEPHILYHEIDDNRFEIRKIDIYKDDSFGIASPDHSFGGTELSEVAVPHIEEINSDAQFHAKEIEKSEFEETWDYYSMFLKNK